MQVDESLRKICHYQHNVPQHHYLLVTTGARGYESQTKRAFKNKPKIVFIQAIGQFDTKRGFTSSY